jgi:transcriptional regulator with XRE-family HTH domain
MDFYDRIKSLTKEAGITIEGMLDNAFERDDPDKLTLGSYNTLRRRGNLPRANQAHKIAAALGVSVEYLITGAEPNTSKPDTAPIIAHLEAALDDLKRL